MLHQYKSDFRKVCKEKLYCDLKPDICEEELVLFLDEVENLAQATDPAEMTYDAVFIVSASW